MRVNSSRRLVRFPFVVSFRFPLYKICVRKWWDTKYVILDEDSNTGGPSSITVTMEYLFAFVGRDKKAHFYFCSWSDSRKWRCGVSPTLSLLCFQSFRNFPPSQKLWKKSPKSTLTGILRTWISVTSLKSRHQPRHLLKLSGHIHHTNHSIRSSFLHTTQLQIKTTPKRRIQIQNHNSKSGADLELI